MQFNSFTFLWFFLAVYSLYIALSQKWQNRMLLIASWIFYGWWDYRFITLIIFSSILDYFCGLRVHASQHPRQRKGWLILSIAGNLSVLGFFKYFNFFIDSMQLLLASVGLETGDRTLHVILPVGISFYTFQTMSYTIDIYRGRMRPTRDYLNFALFVSFFPQLVAGPIERAKNLLPRIEGARALSGPQIKDGLFLIAWGLFKKVIIADNLGSAARATFVPGSDPAGVDVLLALYAFAIRIYCDFSAYSDIARGLAKMMGFELMVNFRLPFFAQSVSEFWARWHISLTSWVRDYLFVPLGAHKGGTARTCFNLILTMTLIGLWHGANWTFVIWGFAYGAIQSIQFLKAQRRLKTGLKPPAAGRWTKASRMLITFHIFALSGLLFRAESITHTTELLSRLCFHFYASEASLLNGLWMLFLSLPLWIMQWAQYRTADLMVFRKQSSLTQFAGVLWCGLMMMAIYLFQSSLSIPDEFIYFQF